VAQRRGPGAGQLRLRRRGLAGLAPAPARRQEEVRAPGRRVCGGRGDRVRGQAGQSGPGRQFHGV